MCKQYTCSCEFILMLITFTYKLIIIIMLICYVTIKLLWRTCLLISSIVAYTELQRTHLYTTSLGPIVRAVSLIPRGLYTCCCRLGWQSCNRVWLQTCWASGARLKSGNTSPLLATRPPCWSGQDNTSPPLETCPPCWSGQDCLKNKWR